MNQTKQSPTKPKAHQLKFTKRPAFILLTVVIMIGLLIGSMIYLLSHYKPPKPQTPKIATNLSIEALTEDQKIVNQTLTENTEEYQDNLDSSDDKNQPTSLEDANNPQSSAVQSRQINQTIKIVVFWLIHHFLTMHPKQLLIIKTISIMKLPNKRI